MCLLQGYIAMKGKLDILPLMVNEEFDGKKQDMFQRQTTINNCDSKHKVKSIL